MAKDVSCLYSKVRNISGETLNLSFLPPHGQTLAPNEEFVMFGSPQDAIANGGSSRIGARRKILAFEQAIGSGLLAIVHTPGVILESPNETSKMLAMDNSNAVSAVAPCFSNAASSISSAY